MAELKPPPYNVRWDGQSWAIEKLRTRKDGSYSYVAFKWYPLAEQAFARLAEMLAGEAMEAGGGDLLEKIGALREALADVRADVRAAVQRACADARG